MTTAANLKVRSGGGFVSLLDIMFPVGSVYLTYSNVNPSKTLGGTWVLYSADRYLRGDASTSAAGATGGSDTISVSQMPSHKHSGTRSITITLKENTQGSENFALSGAVEDMFHTFDEWTNSTGGGHRSTRAMQLSLLGGERRRGGDPSCASRLRAEGCSRTTARTRSGLIYIAPSTRTSSGAERHGSSRSRATTSCRRVLPTFLGTLTAATPIRSRLRRCQTIPTALVLYMEMGRTIRLCKRVDMLWTSKTIMSGSAAISLITTCRNQSQRLCGSGPNDIEHGKEVSHAV